MKTHFFQVLFSFLDETCRRASELPDQFVSLKFIPVYKHSCNAKMTPVSCNAKMTPVNIQFQSCTWARHFSQQKKTSPWKIPKKYPVSAAFALMCGLPKHARNFERLREKVANLTVGAFVALMGSRWL